jgi:hypothetical protein
MSNTGKVLYRVQQGHTYASDADLTVMCCPVCGVNYAIPQTMQAAARSAGERKITWFCPNGHDLGYNGPSEVEKERDRVTSELQYQRDRSGRLAAEVDQTKAKLRAQKGATTKAKRRHAAGLCPCCNRTFQQITRHMATQHPDFDPGADA